MIHDRDATLAELLENQENEQAKSQFTIAGDFNTAEKEQKYKEEINRLNNMV